MVSEGGEMPAARQAGGNDNGRDLVAARLTLIPCQDDGSTLLVPARSENQGELSLEPVVSRGVSPVVHVVVEVGHYVHEWRRGAICKVAGKLGERDIPVALRRVVVDLREVQERVGDHFEGDGG